MVEAVTNSGFAKLEFDFLLINFFLYEGYFVVYIFEYLVLIYQGVV